MNLNKILLIFLLLLQFLFFFGYFYSNQMMLVFSFSSIFDEEFVVMLAMFLVLCLLFIYALQNFQIMFNERIENLNKVFSDVFNQVLVQINNLLNIINKSVLVTQFNTMLIIVLNENIVTLLTQIEQKFFIIFKMFVKMGLLKEKILNEFVYFILK